MADWTTLPAELLRLITQHLSIPTDLLRFRSVCATWRNAARSLLSSADSLTITPNSGICETGWDFFLSKRTVYSLQSPSPGHSSWIVKLDRDNPVQMRFLHPLDRFQFKPLPSAFPREFSFLNFRVTELGDEYALHYINFRPTANSIGEAGNVYMEKVAFLNRGSGVFVLLTIHIIGRLVVYKSGDEKCRLINDSTSPYNDVILCGGKFYAVDNTGRIVFVNTDDFSVTTVAASIFGGEEKVLVDYDGDLLLVDKYLSFEPADDMGFNERIEFYEEFDSFMIVRTVEFKVFKLSGSSGNKRWIETTDLGDKMLFLSCNCAFLASAAETYGDVKCKGNCIIFTDQNSSREDDEGLKVCSVGVFDLESGSIDTVDDHIGCSRMFWPPPDWVYLTASIEAKLNQMNI